MDFFFGGCVQGSEDGNPPRECLDVLDRKLGSKVGKWGIAITLIYTIYKEVK